MAAITQDLNAKLGFKNEHIIYENEIRCKVNENEFNFSHNPTLSTDNSGSIAPFAKGPEFAPYVTTIGLYNNRNELLAVAKLAQAVPLSSVTDTTFVVKYDL
tara:strand:- start:837 stop:1142 length:306 start_codon:yes stop_codon:yes gene_type:complete